MPANQVTVYFGTNRQPILVGKSQEPKDFAEDPGPIDGYSVRFGSALVNVADGDPQLVPGSLYTAPETLTPAKGKEPVFGSRTVFEALRKSMKENERPLIVFIHGFSNSFTDAIERAGGIAAFLAAGGFEADIFVFSWPASSSGTIGVPLPYADYLHDRRTAAASGPALARTLRFLHTYVDGLSKESWCNQEMHLLCHSMGNYVLRNGLQAWLRLPKSPNEDPSAEDLTYLDRASSDAIRMRRTFNQIILAAADEDDDAFDDPKKLQMLPRLGDSVTVYHTAKDWVLSQMSSKTKFNGPRLGVSGPDNMAAISDKVTAVDVSDVFSIIGDDLQGHQYYRKVPAVRDDMVSVLSGTRPTHFATRELLSQGRWLLKS